MRCFIYLIFLTIISSVHAQVTQSYRTSEKVPVFRSKKDSIEYHAVDMAMREISKGENNQKKGDSLWNLRMTISERGIIRYRTVYYPNKNYFQLNDLSELKNYDSINSISISNARTIPE